MTATLCCHKGARYVNRSRLGECQTPPATPTWRPIPHADLLHATGGALHAAGLRVRHEQHALTPNEARYFGILTLAPARGGDDYTLAVGLRNSHDKSMQAGVALGTRVFVCDNLAFSGEVQIGRRHTSGIVDALPALLGDAVARILDRGASMAERIERYKLQRCHDIKAHDLVQRAVDLRVISNQRVPAVIHQWREPRHAEFAPRTAWSLFNAFTEVLKIAQPITLQPKTARLHHLFDDFCHITA